MLKSRHKFDYATRMFDQKDSSRTAIVLGILLGLWALWLAQYHYKGIYQDGYVYAFLATRHLDPLTFQTDLFVRFGSQDRYSLFSLPYAWMVQGFGLPWATLLLMIFGQCLWFGGLVTLARRVLLGRAWLLGVAAIVVMDPRYDPFLGFPYGESLMTPRVFSEALCLFAMAGLWRGRYVIPAALIALGALLHPLIAALACLVWGLVFVSDSRVRPALRVGCAVIAVAGAVGVGLGLIGLTALRASIDEEWYRIIERQSFYVFPAAWTTGGYCKPLCFFLFFGLALHYRLIEARRLVVCLVLATVTLCTIWLVGSGLYRNAFITQLQLWRGLWLVQMLGVLVCVRLLLRLWQGVCAERWMAALLTLAFFNLGLFGLQPSGVAALGAAVVGCMVGFGLARVPPRYLEQRTWRLLPLLLVLPQLQSSVASLAWLQLVLLLAMFGVLIFSGDSRRVICAVCVLLALGLGSWSSEDFRVVIAMVAFLVALVATERDHPAILQWPVRVLAGSVIAILSWPVADVVYRAYLVQVQPHFGQALAPWLGAVLGGCLAFLGWQGWRRRSLGVGGVVLLAGWVLLTGAFCQWLPARAQLQNEAQAAWVRALQSQIPRQATVFSDRGVDWSWYVLHRSYYASYVQSFGAIFSRQNAVESYRRRLFVCGINPAFCLRQSFGLLDLEGSYRPLADTDVQSLCSDRELDFLVLQGHFKYANEVVADSEGHTNSLISCAALRNPGSAAHTP